MEKMDLDKLPDFLKEPGVILKDKAKWAAGSAPDYTLVDELYQREKTTNHEPGSLEDLMTNLVKNWEREASHKTDPTEWRTMDLSKFKFSTNGKWISGEELAAVGNYNALIGECEHYSAKRVASSEESHRLFRGTFLKGFAWEVLEVLSPPPRVAIKWRHWGQVAGGMTCPMRNGQDLKVKGNPGRTLEIFGLTLFTLDDAFRVVDMETFWNPDQLMQQIAASED